MTCLTCDSEPCLCQRELAVATAWIHQTCTTNGCGVMIRSKVGHQLAVPVCKWCSTGQREERERHLKRLREERKQAQEARTPLKEAVGQVMGKRGS